MKASVFTFGDLAVDAPNSLVIGPFGSDLKTSDYVSQGVPVVFVRNVRPGVFNADDMRFVSPEKALDLAAHAVAPGDIVITKMGLPPCVAAEYPQALAQGIVTADIIRLRPNRALAVPSYIVHFLNSDEAKRQVARFTFGVTRPKVTLRDFRAMKIPMPPLNEQARIASILDKADAIRRSRQEAFKLTDELLRSTFLEMFGDPVTNPKGWPVKTLGSIALFTGGGTPARAVPSYFTGSTCWATSKDMKGEALFDTEEHITAEAIENSATKVVPAGTILVVVKSKILMRRLPVLVAKVPTCFGQDLKGITLAAGYSTTFVARHLRLGEKILLDVARGANTEGLTLDHLRRFPIMQPPQKIIEKFDAIEARVVALRAQQEQALKEAEDLYGALAQQFFSTTPSSAKREAA